MTLDEAIAHAEDVAKVQDRLSKRIRTSDAKKCERCAEDHRQLAEWLRDYKRLKEQEPNTGHWIPTVVRGQNSYCCSECLSECCYTPTAFCPDCGCMMVESEDDKV